MSNPEFFGGQLLPAADLQDLGEYGTWTPSLSATTTPPTLGSGAVTDGIYHRNARLITLWFNITFGTSGTAVGTGTYLIQGLPFDIDTLGAGMAAGGTVFINDSSASARYATAPRVQSSTAFSLVRVALEPATEVASTSTPVAGGWAASDSLRGTIIYVGEL